MFAGNLASFSKDASALRVQFSGTNALFSKCLNVCFSGSLADTKRLTRRGFSHTLSACTLHFDQHLNEDGRIELSALEPSVL